MEALKLSWLDSGLWSDLFREAGIRSPAHSLPCTPSGMLKYLKKAGITVSQYVAYTGFQSLGAYPKANPRVPLFAFLGMMLEAKREGLLTESIGTRLSPYERPLEAVISMQPRPT